jgi:nitroimidazol reductase NimA-like FMN-containing flavoprotein (pyridoxamine 5'-phosphate oxidase superfamily)
VETPEVALEALDEAECIRLIGPGGIGRLCFAGRFGLTVLPVNYAWHDGAVVFRTAQYGTTDDDLRPYIPQAEYSVAFEVDDFDTEARQGWSVLIQGTAHHLDSLTEAAQAEAIGLESWAGGERSHFIRIRPARITGRRIPRGRVGQALGS